MPRRNGNAAGSALDQLQQQARALVIALRKEIGSKEAELKRLKEDEARLASLTGTVSTRAAGAPPAPARTTGGRINWSTVLEQLPKQFKAGDVRKIRGLKDKRSAELFAAVTRWIQAGTVKRKERGLYERVSQ
jgi:hypothetical protein